MATHLSASGLFPFYWRTLIRSNAGAALLLSGLMLASAVFQMATIGLTVPLLEVAGNAGSGSWVVVYFQSLLQTLGVTPTGPSLVFGVLVFAGLAFVMHAGLTFLHQSLATYLAERLRERTKARIFDCVLSGQYEAIARRGRGAILQDLTAPPQAIHNAVMRLAQLFSCVVTSVVLMIFMIYLSWWAALLVGVLGMAGLHTTQRIVDGRSRRAGQALHELQAEESRIAIDAIDGLKTLKAHGAEGAFRKRFAALLEAEVRPSLQIARYRYLPLFINEIAAISVVLILGAISLLVPESGMGFPALAAFLLSIRQCGSYVANINALMAELQSVRRSVELLPEVMQQIPRELSGSRAVPPVAEIRFDHVSLQYEGRGEVLHGVDLRMKRGTVTGLVGSTGSGKTSIANLIVGLYRPSAGRILADGSPLGDLDLSQWRRRIGYVTQDNFLFNASIRDNIALWSDAFSPRDIEQAASLAQIDDFVATLPHGYDTVVGDRGLRLSGGQCQRIAIARAILMRPDILVLDEATSALDNLTERAVYEAMSVLRENSIVIAVAHRLSTIKDADQIVVLDAGRIVQVGTHSSLMHEGGAYFRLYETESVHS